jgi:hypothetical protein
VTVPSPRRIRWTGIIASAVLYVVVVAVGLFAFGTLHLWWPFLSAAIAVVVGLLVVWLLYRG